ncbi:MAG: D-alanyl-D-alanine carboxypeptidase/D-alanyl-D-alanine-endopeptidase [Candidatus Melainabacteria bacterium]|nr:D-alanyl-D-alanine carboxypeptidase/D-alanyl-D-alanine-endopeptidase [Candidatus Melainabacteria bacterium]
MKNFIAVLSACIALFTTGSAIAKSQKPTKPANQVKSTKSSTAKASAAKTAIKADAAMAAVTSGINAQHILNAWLLTPTLNNSSVAVEVMDADTKRVLGEINGKRRFIPASSIKALTCACALDTLGNEFTYKTRILTNGKIVNGTLEGDLIIQPSEDPSFSRGDLYSLLDKALSEVQAKQITGRVILAACKTGFSSVWLVEDFGRNWMPVSSSLVLDRNCLALNTLPPRFVQIEGQHNSGSLFERALASKDGPSWVFLEKNQSTGAIEARYISPLQNKLAPFIVSNPNEFAYFLIENYLKDKGFTLQNKTLQLSTKYKDTVVLSEHESKPLPPILQWTLHESDNLYAQQILRTLGFASLDLNSVDLSEMQNISLEEKGIGVIFKWLSQLKVGAQEVVMFDGCGLSRKNGISPHALNTIFAYMNQKPQTRPFFNLLKAEQGKGAASSYRFKTGTMETVRCISGLLATNSGQKLALTIMVNGHTPSVRNLRIVVGDLVNKLKNAKVK